MTARLAALALLLPLAACSGVTYDQAYGRPDATRWTYFEASAERLQPALETYFLRSNWYLEASREEGEGLVLRFAPRQGGVEVVEILIQRSPVDGFGSRAQLYPRARPLPREMEAYASRRS